MINAMKVRSVFFASVSSAFLVASAAASGPAYASSPNVNQDLTNRAYQALRAGQADTAIADYTKAIESQSLEPEVLANALLNRALAHQQLAEHEKAIDDYTAALQLDAMSADLRATALYNRGVSFQRVKKLPDAVEDFTSALLLNTSFSHAYFNRGNALRESGQLLYALSDFERAARYKYPNMAKVHYSTGLTYASLKRPNDAAKSFNQALAVNPNMAEAKRGLEKLGNDQAATEVAASDDILTGSIAALGGGLVVRKPDLPKAVEPPDSFAPGTVVETSALVAENTAAPEPIKMKKRFVDRVPAATAANKSIAKLDEGSEQAITLDAVPAIPAAEVAEASIAKKAKTKIIVTPVSAEPESQSTSDVDVHSGWAVQIASANSEAAAWSTWKKMQRAKPALTDFKPAMVRADLGKKGIFYRVRLIGFDDQKGAQSTCAKLKTSGVDCYISKANS
jgi:tetratricopeptide (TPR) repeat protein